MSISPSQKSWNPSPVPGPSTRTWTSGFSSAYSSATSDVIGSTVDEPDTITSPESCAAAGDASAARRRPATAATSDEHAMRRSMRIT